MEAKHRLIGSGISQVAFGIVLLIVIAGLALATLHTIPPTTNPSTRVSPVVVTSPERPLQHSPDVTDGMAGNAAVTQ